MAIGTYEDTFYGYARKWFESVNRGGAFEVSDSAFDFFLVVEKSPQHSLKSYLHTRSDQKDVKKLRLDDNILFHWFMLSHSTKVGCAQLGNSCACTCPSGAQV